MHQVRNKNMNLGRDYTELQNLKSFNFIFPKISGESGPVRSGPVRSVPGPES